MPVCSRQKNNSSVAALQNFLIPLTTLDTPAPEFAHRAEQVIPGPGTKHAKSSHSLETSIPTKTLILSIHFNFGVKMRLQRRNHQYLNNRIEGLNFYLMLSAADGGDLNPPIGRNPSRRA